MKASIISPSVSANSSGILNALFFPVFFFCCLREAAVQSGRRDLRTSYWVSAHYAAQICRPVLILSRRPAVFFKFFIFFHTILLLLVMLLFVLPKPPSDDY